MTTRIEFHNILCDILGNDHVYYQPPEKIKIVYPAIIYNRKNIEKVYADNFDYLRGHTYQVIVIDKNPDSEIVEKILSLPYTSYERHYVSDGLNHDVFNIKFN